MTHRFPKLANPTSQSAVEWNLVARWLKKLATSFFSVTPPLSMVSTRSGCVFSFDGSTLPQPYTLVDPLYRGLSTLATAMPAEWDEDELLWLPLGDFDPVDIDDDFWTGYGFPGEVILVQRFGGRLYAMGSGHHSMSATLVDELSAGGTATGSFVVPDLDSPVEAEITDYILASGESIAVDEVIAVNFDDSTQQWVFNAAACNQITAS